MHVITVDFTVKPEHCAAFRTAVLAQARNSLEKEADCHRFDVSISPDDSTQFFLYELYTDEAAFEVHMRTEHYHNFAATVAPWIASKSVRALTLLG